MSTPISPLRFPALTDAITHLPKGDLTPDGVRAHIFPLFSRVLSRATHEIYLANHSLGRPLDQTALDIQGALDHWYTHIDGAWGGIEVDPICPTWMDAIDRYRALVAQLIGVNRSDAVVPKTAAGQGLRAVLNAISDHGMVPRVLTTRGEFDSIDFILKTYAGKGRAELTFVELRGKRGPVPVLEADDIIAALRASKHDLVVLSQVYFMTGHRTERLDDIIDAAHAQDTLVLVDTYHAAGVLPMGHDPLRLNAPIGAPGADFAIGGNYKYTRGGCGSCWLAIAPKHLQDDPNTNRERALTTLDTGWFAKEDTFAYRRPDEPRLSPGGDAWLESTPPVLTAYQALAGLELTLAIGVDRLRTYSLAQQAQLRANLREVGVDVVEPQDPEQWGGYSLVPTDDPMAFSSHLRTMGVNTDARQGFVRFGPDILNTEAELAAAAGIVAAALQADSATA